jgi:DNA-binding LacI/PurR family transcriptional regulator
MALRKNKPSMHEFVTEQLRDRILRSEFKPGSVLPTMHELASEFKTSYFTIQTALTPLVDEGLLERKRRVGTIVRRNPNVLTCVGIYCTAHMFDGWDYAFVRELCKQLQLKLSEMSVETVLFADIREHEHKKQSMPDLINAIQQQKIQGLLVVQCDQDNIQWLKELPVASTFLSSVKLPNRVVFDSTSMLRLSLERLRAQGCTTVGMISSIQIPINTHHEYFKFYREFVDIVSELKMRTRNDWVLSPEQQVRDQERYGYEAFAKLWLNKDKPQGLFVYPDSAARGSMTALLELGLRVPGDLKVICHRNTGVNWLAPQGVECVEADVSMMASEMIQQIIHQKNGKKVQSVILPYRSLNNKTDM